MKFNEDFTAVFFNLAKDDGHFESKGIWASSEGIVSCQDNDINRKFLLKVISLTEDEFIFEIK
ncbi:MAG: hypothetical protein RLZZ546_1722 [Bacteroidota bacterium]|jgi:hypothetical protein